MFLNNKYTKLYYNIIQNAKPNLNDYYENHHIIPRSLGGGDEPSNIVSLTAREHFLCHYLLTKMLEPKTNYWYKMIKAFMMVSVVSRSHQESRYINSKLYEQLKRHFSETQSFSQSGIKNSQHGTFWMTDGQTNIKCSVETELFYLNKGFYRGRYKPKRIKPSNVLKTLRAHEATITKKVQLYSFLERYLSGESIRSVAKDYDYSHVALYKAFQRHFPEHLDCVVHGTTKRQFLFKTHTD